MPKYYTRGEVIEAITYSAHLEGGLGKLAKKWRVNRVHLSSVVNGREPPSRKMLKRLGLVKVDAYKRAP